MQEYQKAFIELAITRGALRFGDFTLKSGRCSPYFFNTGVFSTGESLKKLGEFYAHTVLSSGLKFDMLFGLAYKGIPLVTATALALYTQYGTEVPLAFNRKEVKDHGDEGSIVGTPLAGRVLILDDVISAGTSVREAIAPIQTAGAISAGVIISLDRQERGTGSLSAVAQVEYELGIPVRSVIQVEHLLEYLEGKPGMASALTAVRKYQDLYRA
ncbi:orotate phosphoribosyltransferase [Gammaproteobacteria bacterium]